MSKTDQRQTMQMPTGADQGQPRALCTPQKCDGEWSKRHQLQVTPKQKQRAKENVRHRSVIFYESSSVQIYFSIVII